MRRFVLGLFAAVAAAGAGPLLAAEEDDLFTKLDANKDGFVTADEVGDDNKAKFERQLRNADKDGDKKLSKEEFAASLKPDDAPKQPLGAPGGIGRPGAAAGFPFNPKEIFARLDTNKDGKLGKDEARGPLSENFARVDADGDGSITEEEFGKVAAAFARPGGAPGAPGGPAGLGRDAFARLDSDKDGKITKEEAQGPIRDVFDRIDANSDGSLSEEELAQAPSRFGSQPPGGPRPGGPGFRPPFFVALDADSDGELSAEEIEAAGKALLKLDRNGDGKLGPGELFGGPPEGFPGRPPGEGRPGEGRPGDARPGERRPGADAAAAAERFKAADANGDGKLSKEEAPDRLKENFDRLDANSDGFIDEAELRQAFSRRADGERRPDGARRPDGERRPDGDRPRDGGGRLERRPDSDRPAEPKSEPKPE